MANEERDETLLKLKRLEEQDAGSVYVHFLPLFYWLNVCLFNIIIYSALKRCFDTGMNPIVNKSCNLACCGNEVHQIVMNMMLSQYL